MNAKNFSELHQEEQEGLVADGSESDEHIVGFNILLKVWAKVKYALLIGMGFFICSWVLLSAGYYWADSAPSMSIYEPNEDMASDRAVQAFDGVTKYGSVPGAMFFSLLNIQGEHPLATDHKGVWGRIFCMLAWMVGTLTVAIPAGLVGNALRELFEEDEALKKQQVFASDPDLKNKNDADGVLNY